MVRILNSWLPVETSSFPCDSSLRGPWCLLRSMNDSDNVQLVGFHVIDNPVRAFQDFPYLREIDFWDDAARLWKCGNLLGASGEAINDPQGVLW